MNMVFGFYFATGKPSSFSFAVRARILFTFTYSLHVKGRTLLDTNYTSILNYTLLVNLTHELGHCVLNSSTSNASESSLNFSSAPPAACHLRAVCYFGNPAENSKVSGLDVEADTYLVTAGFDPETNYSIRPTRIVTVDDHDLKQWWEAGNVSVGDLLINFGLSNAWSGLPEFGRGGGAFIQRDISECLRSIRATEIDRGFDYETVAFSRSDLHWVCHGNDTIPGINECIIPCPNSDWGGVCDQHALCGRNAAQAYANVRPATVLFMSNALPQHRANRGRGFHSESFLRWRLETQGVKIRRAPDAFVRACRNPTQGEKIVNVYYRCKESKKLGFWVKKSGDQLAHTLQACGLPGEPLKPLANIIKPARMPAPMPASKPAPKPAPKPAAMPAKSSRRKSDPISKTKIVRTTSKRAKFAKHTAVKSITMKTTARPTKPAKQPAISTPKVA